MKSVWMLAALVAIGAAAPAMAATAAPAVIRVADNEERTYQVIVNSDGRYSIWPADRELPAGWDTAGFSGSKAECLAWIREHH